MNDDASKWPELEELEFNPKEDVVVIPYSSGTTGLQQRFSLLTLIPGLVLTIDNFG